ncbi:uncharacterized protein LOC131166959 isoform X3 [Malania oleifera]|uniref:uncharacterized protein LOC131166959 isoform X3 n=2 Tax=Malania oleifera TaxID=397392 RepID=UPI0025AE7F3F|nr:uncharacterized protein LOC131166959 isoform X3 [Malania oleifera]XP_057981619.1 uncharacterized protein LOC131166959 isoform X3 [Malania oleifera]XP_057981620.1 uncharacterized protein LOC131166959 isoform X3 [Malania oleifera]
MFWRLTEFAKYCAMGPDLELVGKTETAMDVLANKTDGTTPKDHENNILKCTSNYEYNASAIEAFLDEHTMPPDGNEDRELDIMDCVNTSNTGIAKTDCHDATESSSSFGDTLSGIEDGSLLSDAEVQSELRGHNTSAMIIDGCGEVFRVRKKKLTAHWMRYIHPLMWRCKWIELQIKEFQSQALKYDRELAEYGKKKQFELEKFTEEVGARSVPFPDQHSGKKVMKRKKRERVEDMTDIASYMSHHNLFSYYEVKRPAADGASMDDACRTLDKTINGNVEFGAYDDWPFLELGNGDNSLEQILRRIGEAESQVHKLKGRVDKLISENAGNFSSTNNLSMLVPCDALTCSTQNPASPPSSRDKKPIGSIHTASHGIWEDGCAADVVLPEHAVSNHVGVPRLDIIESTNQPCVEGSWKTGEGILLQNQKLKEELHNCEEPVGKPQVPKDEQENAIPPVLAHKIDSPKDEQPSQKLPPISRVNNASKNKRKRGRRKAGGGWSQRTHG